MPLYTFRKPQKRVFSHIA